MGKRTGRKLTRNFKRANPEVAFRQRIAKDIDEGLALHRIADGLTTDFHIKKERAVKIVMAEFDIEKEVDI